jgi:hypothetical protein
MTSSWIVFLLVGAVIGGADVGYFHVLRFRLASRAASRGETLAHLVQGASFAGLCVGALVAPTVAPFILGMFGAHFAAVAIDVVLERRSRADLGGLPTLELILHVAGATTTGGAFAAYLASPAAPTAVERFALVCALVAALASVLVELAMVVAAARGTTRPFSRGEARQGAGA